MIIMYIINNITYWLALIDYAIFFLNYYIVTLLTTHVYYILKIIINYMTHYKNKIYFNIIYF